MKTESQPDRRGQSDDIPQPTNATSEGSALKADLASLNDRYRRLAADFDNFKKRTHRDADQRAAEQKNAFIRELLPVVDNLERALASPSADQLREGIELTHRELIQVLHRHGVEADDPSGLPFDPHRHEAVSIRFDPEQADHLVVGVLQRGYVRGDEIIRPARVVVNDLSAGEGADDAD